MPLPPPVTMTVLPDSCIQAATLANIAFLRHRNHVPCCAFPPRTHSEAAYGYLVDDHHRLRGRRDRKIHPPRLARAVGLHPHHAARHRRRLCRHLSRPGARLVPGRAGRGPHRRRGRRRHRAGCVGLLSAAHGGLIPSYNADVTTVLSAALSSRDGLRSPAAATSSRRAASMDLLARARSSGRSAAQASSSASRRSFTVSGLCTESLLPDVPAITPTHRFGFDFFANVVLDFRPLPDARS